MSEENGKFKVNPNHNYYACPVARPGSQLFLVRLEWEADAPQSECEGKCEGECDGECRGEGECESDNFSIALIYFAGMQYILVGLERSAHDVVQKIAAELNLKVIQGYPLSRSKKHENDKKDQGKDQKDQEKNQAKDQAKDSEVIEHFPISSSLAADSIYTIEGRVDVTDSHKLWQMKKEESLQVQAYLEKRYKELPADGNDDSEFDLVDDPTVTPAPRKQKG